MIHFSFNRLAHWVRRSLVVGFVTLLSLTSVLAIAVPPSAAQVPFNSQEAHGQTLRELTGRSKDAPLTPEERLDRAYSISEAAGLREEKRQAEGKFDPKEDNESLVEKAKDAVQELTGQ
ncbi:MAG: hypothetical protein ACFBSG_05730 [Leptolyngbyaceae cyanobacterium]